MPIVVEAMATNEATIVDRDEDMDIVHESGEATIVDCDEGMAIVHESGLEFTTIGTQTEPTRGCSIACCTSIL